MKIENSQKSNSFRAPLLELVIIIGIFAIVSVYLLRMFMVSDKLQGKAVATTTAVVKTTSVAEFIKGIDGSAMGLSGTGAAAYCLTRVQQEFGGTISGNTLKIDLNKSFENTSNTGDYTIVVNLEEDASFLFGKVGMYSSDRKDTFCELEVKREKQ